MNRHEDGQLNTVVQVDSEPTFNNELAGRLGEMARELQHKNQPDEILESIVRSAIELIPGVDDGSVSVVIGRKDVSSRAASSDLPARVDAIQMQVGQGPCLQAAYEHQTVLVPDMSAEARWPEFARLASDAGAASMLSFQLFVHDDNLGALNLYARKPNAFTEESEQVGFLVAAHAAVAFADSLKVGQLNDALASRDVIGQAKGILMERYKLTAQQAFLLLTKASSETNMKLTKLAGHLAETGELPPRR